MNPGAGEVEVSAYEGCHGRKIVIRFLYDIVRDLGDDAGLHTVERTAELRILEYHSFKRNISGSFTYSEK